MLHPDDQSTKTRSSTSCQECTPRLLSRRTVLRSALCVGLGLQFASPAIGDGEEQKKIRPQVGDAFVFSAENRQGQIITPQDLPLGGPPVVAYPTGCWNTNGAQRLTPQPNPLK